MAASMFRIADTFTDSLARLTGDEQKAVKTTAFDLQINAAKPGMHFHKLERARDKSFWSVRVNSDVRLIVHRTDASLLLCYVGHHDKAYEWAERRKLTTGYWQVVNRAASASAAQAPSRPPSPLAELLSMLHREWQGIAPGQDEAAFLAWLEVTPVVEQASNSPTPALECLDTLDSILFAAVEELGQLRRSAVQLAPTEVEAGLLARGDATTRTAANTAALDYYESQRDEPDVNARLDPRKISDWATGIHERVDERRARPRIESVINVQLDQAQGKLKQSRVRVLPRRESDGSVAWVDAAAYRVASSGPDSFPRDWPVDGLDFVLDVDRRSVAVSEYL